MTLAREMALESEYVMGTFARKPVEFVEGHGMTLIDDAGNEYLDFLSGIGVCSLGHCHPSIVQAVSDQAAKLIHVSNYYYIEHRGEVAQLLSNMLNAYVDEPSPETWKTFFANSGAEANECAIKLARLYARRRTEAAGKDAELAPRLIVTLAKSFHGRTLATLAATAQPAKQEAFQPLPAGFTATPINDVEALERLFETQGDRICAVMIECIQGESGVHPCTEEFVGAIRRLTEEHGALMICDEVQSGIFRTGLPYGFQNFGVLPDIVTMAKGIASGVVAGACAAKSSIAAAFAPGDHGTTFGGSNIAMAAAHVTLSTLLAPGMGAQIFSPSPAALGAAGAAAGAAGSVKRNQRSESDHFTISALGWTGSGGRCAGIGQRAGGHAFRSLAESDQSFIGKGFCGEAEGRHPDAG